jgi:hydrogenase maturation protein HypF
MGAGSVEAGMRVPDAPNRARVSITVRGVVQGVGFRPFVYALARELGLSGAVGNSADGVRIEAEGPPAALQELAIRLRTDAPALALIDTVSSEPLEVRGGTDFVIQDSRGGTGRTLISPDVATCDACLAELADPADRRFRHAFISCTNCGPRFTVIVDLPYDRPATTMSELPLCPRCALEYADPADRRFHAQTVACPECGPTVRLRRPGEFDIVGDNAIQEARHLLAQGGIVAVKGLGGYHLACDALDSSAVTTLRKRKDRGDKPFAVMVRDVATARRIAELSPAAEQLLTDARRPVVLLPARRDAGGVRLARDVAPDTRLIGVMLAYTPVHHLLFGLASDATGPAVLVMTSGNLSGEPIVIDDEEAYVRLGSLADAWLTHDRPIHVPCDDSVVRLVDGDVLPVRRSRGFAPLPIALPVPVRAALAVGGDLKNTFAVGEGGYAWLSAHVGDMDDLATLRAFESAATHLSAVTRVQPEVVVADRHPAYRSSAWARRRAEGRPVPTVQHHHAHIASAMAENGHDGREPVIGFAFDGTGYGDDGAVWGGEVLLATYDGYQRAAHLRYVWLPGGDAGVRNPCRMALSHLYAAGRSWDLDLPPVRTCSAQERAVLSRQVTSGLGSVRTSSMGRLFDAVSSLADVCHRVAYEAEAAMVFESLASEAIDECGEGYHFGDVSSNGGPSLVDPAPVILAVASDVLAGVDREVIAARFHRAVAAMVVDVAIRLRTERDLSTVALSGGVFLNALLTELCSKQLHYNGFSVLRHRLVPPSDAGLALGQLIVAARPNPVKEDISCA